MKLYFATELRIQKLGDDFYVPEAFSLTVWERYLKVFESITLIARVEEVSQLTISSLKRLKDDRVSVVSLPCYNGLWEYIKRRKEIKDTVSQIAKKGNAYILRVPGQIGSLVGGILHKKKIPYAVEVVGDPWEALSPQAYKHVLSPILQYVGKTNLQRVVHFASASLFVTSYTLQRRYPPFPDTYTTNASNVQLNIGDIRDKVRDPFTIKTQYNLVAVGTLAQLYKAPDIILKALASLKSYGIQFRFTWYGDGKYKEAMMDLSHDLGLKEEVCFAGNVSTAVIQNALKEADIFIHASRAEGLPRALIEAMAAGLPAIGSNVAGIPELLLEDAIIPPNNPAAVTEKLLYFINNPDRMKCHAEHNLGEAKKYEASILSERRTEFYEEIKRISKV